MFFVFFCIFGITTLVVTLLRLLKSKIAIKVELNSQSEILKCYFSTKKFEEIPFDALAFAFTERYSHNSLTIYKTFLGTREQLVKKKLTELIGLRVTLSWQKKQLREIAFKLEKQGIHKTLADNRDLPLWERIISN